MKLLFRPLLRCRIRLRKRPDYTPRLTGEVTDWQGHPPEQLQATLDHLAELKRLGIEAIETKSMKVLLLTIVVLCSAMGSVVAQKKSTFMGDLVVGELAGKNEATREIAIKYPGKEGAEIFSGILADDCKLKLEMSGGGDLMLSEIMQGTHIRVFYKNRSEKVSGQEKKINKISRLEVLGEDRYFRIRRELHLDPSTAIAAAENGVDLPTTSPLKLYLSIPYDDVQRQIVEWIEKWNRKNGVSFGKLEIVSDVDHADTLIVVAVGSDTIVAEIPDYDTEERVNRGVWSQATSYLVVKNAGRLTVLWTNVDAVYVTKNTGISPRTAEAVTGEIAKRIKARSSSLKK